MTATPKIAVFQDAQSIQPRIYDGPGTYSDLAGTVPSRSPLVVGIWDILDFEEPTPSATADTDEAKYVVQGEAVIKDDVTGELHQLKPGSLLWIPHGAKMSIVSSKSCRTVYFEARHMTQSVEPVSDKPTKTEKLHIKLGQLVTRFIEQNPSSKAAIERASKTLPGGSTRAVLESHPFPLVVRSGTGSTLTSIDGATYLDFVSDFTAALFGHSEPRIQQAITQAAEGGFSLGAVTELEAELSESINTRFPSIELVRFCNSGTEANTYAIGTALAYTNRKKVMVFDRSYHGGSLSFGDIENKLNLPYEFVMGAYNNIEETLAALSAEIGAIVVEPMQSAGGMRPAQVEFLGFLRKAANALRAVLIFDEVVTSRLDYHGLQGVIGIQPDLTTLGKYLGGGLPFGAFGGKKEIMQQFDINSGSASKLSHSGTFNNNVFTMSAAVAASKIVTKESIDRINDLGQDARDGIADIVKAAGKTGEIAPVGLGSCVGIHFCGEDADVLRDVFFFRLISQGIWVGRRGFLVFNFSHTEKDLKMFLDAFEEFVTMDT